MSLQTVMNLNHMVILVWLVQTDEGLDYQTNTSLPHRHFLSTVKWRKHDNYKKQLIESQFNFVCVIMLRNSHGISCYSRRKNLHKTYI